MYDRFSQFQPWETAGLPLTSWLGGVSPVTEDQILGLEHAQRLWDLARIEVIVVVYNSSNQYLAAMAS